MCSVLCVRTTQRVVVVDENLLLLSETRRGVRNRREKRKLRASYVYVYMYIVIYTRIYIQCHVHPEFSPGKPEAFQPLSHCKTRREDIILVKGSDHVVYRFVYSNTRILCMYYT